jgi:hypothetical protein
MGGRKRKISLRQGNQPNSRKKRKKRKEEGEEWRQTITVRSMQSLRHGKFANLELRRTKIDDGSMFETRRPQVAERLGDMLISYGFGSLDFENEPSLQDNVCDVFTDDGAIFVVYSQRLLLLDIQTPLPQTMDQSVLVHFLQVAGAVIAMDGVAGFANDVRQLEYAVFHNPCLQDS